MKKVALSLAGVLAAAAFAPEASAIPAFARQTGMACTACHAQHFPILNGFGRAFKAAGFTMMGAQEKVEGEHLSLPGSLNAAVLLKARYQKTNGVDAPASTAAKEAAAAAAFVPTIAKPTYTPKTITNAGTKNAGQWQIPDELSLFFGGRVADSDMIKVGMMMENNMVGGPAGGIIAGLRLPIVVDLGVAKVSVIPFVTDALGPFYGYSESSAGVTRGIRWAEHRAEISAHQYKSLTSGNDDGMGAGTASGLAFVAHHEMGYINVSRWSPEFAYVPGATGVAMTSTAVHMAVTPTVADWAIVAGVDMLTGSSFIGAGTEEVNTKATGFSAQAHGAIAEMETGIYATYVTMPKSSAAANAIANWYNGDTDFDTKAFTIGADVTVIPHALSIGAAYRNASFGHTNTITAGAVAEAETDNAITLTAVYDLFQNVALHANYSMYSGTAYKKGGAKDAVTANATTGKKGSDSLFTGMLEAAW